MTAPLIGITTYGQDESGKFPLPREYVDSVRRAGGIPVLLAPGETDVVGVLQRIDGLILAGGGDIDPKRYDGDPHAAIYMTDDERDTTEFALAREAIERHMPLLAICRGTQIVNVVCGGTLYEHLPDALGDAVEHRIPPPNPRELASPTQHPIRVEPDSRLAALLGVTQFAAASWHHQAVRDVGRDLEVVAHAPDGAVEALEMPTHPWLFAVQWHPELTAGNDRVQQTLFAELVSAASI